MTCRRVLPRLGALLLAACAPDLDVRGSLVDRDRVLAVVAEPAEARPGENVRYTLHAGGPEGPLGDPEAFISYCETPKGLVENGSVPEACLAEPGVALPALMDAQTTGAVPPNACRVYGPDPPPGDFRPRDADATGGWFQPVRIAAFEEVAFHLQRLRCDPPDVAADVAREFSLRYVANQNPSGIALAFVVNGTRLAAPHGIVTLTASERVELVVTWDVATREHYALIDPAAQSVVDAFEALRFDFFVTAGTLSTDRLTVVDPSVTRTAAVYRAPAAPGPAHLWLVVHDSRGGTAVLSCPLAVRSPQPD